MTGVVYPTESGGNSGGTYTVGYNTLGQPTTLSDGTTDPLTGLPVLINNATYGPAGELLTITGSTSGGYNETRTYNSRLQLTSLNGVTFTYPSNATNNGKIASQTEASSGETIGYLYVQSDPISSTDRRGTNLEEPRQNGYECEFSASEFCEGWDYGGGGGGDGGDGGGGGDPAPDPPYELPYYQPYDPLTKSEPADPDPIRPECDSANVKNKRYLDFIKAHRSDAQKLASKLGVSIEDVLGVAAAKSALGTSNLAGC